MFYTNTIFVLLMLKSKEINEKISKISIDFLKNNAGTLSFNTEIEQKLFHSLIKGAIIQSYLNKNYIEGIVDDFEKY